MTININGDEELAAKSHLAAIIESSDDAIISKNIDGIITSWNSAAELLFGYTAREAIGKHITLIIPDDRLDEELVIIGKIKAGQKVDHFETIRKNKNGEELNLSITVSPVKNKNGKIIGASKIARDTSFTKDAERTKAYLAAIINSSDDAIISTDLKGYITSWNKSAECVYGYTSSEAIGKSIKIIIPITKQDEELIIIGRIKAGEKVEHFETTRIAKNKKLIDISLTASPIRDINGNVIGVSKVARDITDYKETQIALKKAQQKKEEFLASISHELRTPMTSIIGLSQILSTSKGLNSKEKLYLETLNKSANNMLLLINDLLDYSKLESGLVVLEKIDFSLKELIDKTLSSFEIMASDKGLTLNATINEKIREFYQGDPLRIQQILTNLIGNAIKFTDSGSINLTINGIEKDHFTELTLIIKDTGIGISKENIEIIFEKFLQADNTVTRKYGGSGLGLSITKTLVNKMGGLITVESKEKIGSIFTIKLPLEHSENSTLLTQSEPSIMSRKNILIVEDYEPNIIVLSAMLDIFDYSYDIANNGLHALRKYSENQYDVILMDIQMEEMDGLESTKNIRDCEFKKHLKQTPIIAMTAHIQEKNKEICYEVGMNDFISKPYDFELLKEKLEFYINT